MKVTPILDRYVEKLKELGFSTSYNIQNDIVEVRIYKTVSEKQFMDKLIISCHELNSTYNWKDTLERKLGDFYVGFCVDLYKEVD